MLLRRFLITVALLSMSFAGYGQYVNGAGAFSELYDTDAQSRMRSAVKALSSDDLQGRRAGSAGEETAAEYVAAKLAENGVDILSGDDLFGIRQENGDTLTSRNVVGFIPGYDKALRERYIVIGARLDNVGSYDLTVDGQTRNRICNGANGNASGLSMLIELASRLQKTSYALKRSVVIVAFGSSLQSNAGAWYFLNRSFADAGNIDAMINLDMVGTGSSGFYAYAGSDQWLEGMLQTVSSTLQPVKPQVVRLEPCASDHRAFQAKGIPSVMFTTGMYPEYNSWKDIHTIVDFENMERELEYVCNFTMTLANSQVLGTQIPAEAESRPIPYYECDHRPSFLGSTDPKVFLQNWVYVYLRYPSSAIRNGIQGKVMVDFVIDEKGKVRDVKVVKGVDPLLDEEAVRVISASPDWKPGRVRGKKVRCGMTLYVEFRLEKKK